MTNSELNILSFPDVDLTRFEVDVNMKSLFLESDEAYLGIAPDGRFIASVRLTIYDYEKLSIEEYGLNNKGRSIIYDNEGNSLKDACEFIYSQGLLTIRGFSRKTGLWTEYIFSGGTIDLCYKECIY